MGDLTTLANVKAYLGMQGVPITGITKANPGVVSAPNHNLLNGAQALISNVLGMTQINGVPFFATVLDPGSFSVGIDTTGFTTYAGAGIVGQDDALLQRLITALSAWVETYCNRHFLAADYVESYNGLGGSHQKQVLKNFPIISVAGIGINGTITVPASASPNLPGFAFDDSTVYLRSYGFIAGYQNVQISYRAGYDVIPTDLEQNVIGLIAWRYRESKRIGQTSNSLGGVTTVSFAIKDMPPDVLTGLQQYKTWFTP